MQISFWTSKVTWSIILTFLIAGAEAVGWLPHGTAIAIITVLSGYGLSIHSNQITTGRIGKA